MTSLTFLGTGGGRFATIYQVRSTGGIYLRDRARLHLDPGPSALANMRRLALDPARTDGVLISHCHPDHYADAEILVEGMARGGFKRSGVVVGSRTVLDGGEGFSPALSAYHQSLAREVVRVAAGDELEIEGVGIEVTPTFHSDPTGVGFRFHTSQGIIGYVGDSELHDELARAHQGCRALVVNLTRPRGAWVPKHMDTEDAAALVAAVRPEVAVLTHFGMKLVHDGPERQAAYIEQASGVRTVPAEDLMTFQIGKAIRVVRSKGERSFAEPRDLDL